MLLLLLGCFLLMPCNAKEKKNDTLQEWQIKANEYFATNNIPSVLKLYRHKQGRGDCNSFVAMQC